MDILQKYLLDADEIDLRPILREINAFKDEIMTSIKNGEHTYLPNGSVKDFGAYKDPYSIQSIKAALAWNILNPNNMIEPPAKVSIVKLNIMSPNDIKDLEKVNKEAYDIIMDKVFINDETGAFLKKTWIEGIHIVNPKKKEWYNEIPPKYRTKYKKLGVEAWNEFAEAYEGPELNGHYDSTVKGMQSIAIPSNSTIPEYLLPYVDYATMINTILAPFKPVLAILKAQTLDEGKTINGTNRKTKAVTNIIKF